MEVKVKKNQLSGQDLAKDQKLIKILDTLLRKLQTPGLVHGLFGSYLEGDITVEELTSALKDLSEDETRLRNMIPVFNEYLEVDHAIDKEYGLLANYKPLFDEEQNLVGFVPHWVLEKE